jgi:hypothetical protein
MNNDTTQPVDTLMLTLAQRAYETGMARELWAAMVCEARGLEHNLPQSTVDLLRAQLADLAVTHETLNR